MNSACGEHGRLRTTRHVDYSTVSTVIVCAGHRYAQALQPMHGSDTWPKGVVTFLRGPLPLKPMALLPETSVHARTHRPHRKQFVGTALDALSARYAVVASSDPALRSYSGAIRFMSS